MEKERDMIVIEDLNKSFGEVKAVNNLRFKVKKGELFAFLGVNGAGKSTTISMICGQLSADSGSIFVGGYDVNKESREIKELVGVVFQDFRLLADRNVYENIAFAQKVIETPTKEIKRQVPAMLSLVGLAEKYKSYPNQLSGGEQQRVALARALVNKPEILLADEPTGNLDPANSWEIMKLLDEANARGTTVVVVTHNKDIVNAMQKRVITMKKGVIIADQKQGGYIDEN